MQGYFGDNSSFDQTALPFDLPSDISPFTSPRGCDPISRVRQYDESVILRYLLSGSSPTDNSVTPKNRPVAASSNQLRRLSSGGCLSSRGSPLSSLENLEASPLSRSHLASSAVKIEGEDVLVVDAIPVRSVLRPGGGSGNLRIKPLLPLQTDSGGLPSSSSLTGYGGLYKKEICRSWEDLGTCRFGAKCVFAHGKEEIHPRTLNRSKSEMDPSRFPSYASVVAYGRRSRSMVRPPVAQPQPSSTVGVNEQGSSSTQVSSSTAGIGSSSTQVSSSTVGIGSSSTQVSSSTVGIGSSSTQVSSSTVVGVNKQGSSSTQVSSSTVGIGSSSTQVSSSTVVGVNEQGSSSTQVTSSTVGIGSSSTQVSSSTVGVKEEGSSSNKAGVNVEGSSSTRVSSSTVGGNKEGSFSTQGSSSKAGVNVEGSSSSTQGSSSTAKVIPKVVSSSSSSTAVGMKQEGSSSSDDDDDANREGGDWSPRDDGIDPGEDTSNRLPPNKDRLPVFKEICPK